MTSPQDDIPIGLALGSGVARGFAHIGALQALERHGLRPKMIAGASIGAVVGACYLAGKLDLFRDWALSLTRMRVLSYMDLKVRSAGLIGGNRIVSELESHFGDMRVEDLPLPFVAVATDLATGHEVWLRSGRIVDVLRASFALPGVFAPVTLDGRLLLDGALVNPVPVSVCQALGARMTIAVDLNADMIGKARKPGRNYQTVMGFDIFSDKDVPPETRGSFGLSMITRRLFRREENAPSLFGVMVSALNIVQDRLTRSRLAGDPPDVHIKPLIGQYGLLEFEKAASLIREGETATERALPDIWSAQRVLSGGPPAED